jgi:capsular polysaccharide biosynthesis protein
MGAAELHGDACAAHLWRRAPVVLALACLAALTTLPVAYARRGAPEYHARVELFVHPARSTSVHHVPDAMRVLGDDSAVIVTVVGVLGSDGFVASAVARAEVRTVPRVAVHAVAHTDIVRITVTGGDREDVVAVADAMPPTAQEYLTNAFANYEIDALGTATRRVPSFPPAPATVALAFAVGLAAALAFAGWEWSSARRHPCSRVATNTAVVPIR